MGESIRLGLVNSAEREGRPMELGTTGEGERAQPGDSTPRSHTGSTGEEAGEGEGRGVRTGAPEGELSSVLLPTSLPQSALPPPVLPGVHGDTLTLPPPSPWWEARRDTSIKWTAC